MSGAGDDVHTEDVGDRPPPHSESSSSGGGSDGQRGSAFQRVTVRIILCYKISSLLLHSFKYM